MEGFAAREVMHRADIEGRGSYISHIDLEPILYTLHIYIILYIYTCIYMFQRADINLP